MTMRDRLLVTPRALLAWLGAFDSRSRYSFGGSNGHTSAMTSQTA